MNFVRRFGIVILIPILISGYYGVRHFRRLWLEQDVERMAQATAEIWVATATYRDSADVFLAYRDSVLTSHQLSQSDIDAFTSRFRETSEEYAGYMSRVNDLVDSLAKERMDLAYDSANHPGHLIRR